MSLNSTKFLTKSLLLPPLLLQGTPFLASILKSIINTKKLHSVCLQCQSPLLEDYKMGMPCDSDIEALSGQKAPQPNIRFALSSKLNAFRDLI